MRTVEDLPATVLATAAAVAASGTWYAASGRRPAELDDAYAEDPAGGTALRVRGAREGPLAAGRDHAGDWLVKLLLVSVVTGVRGR